MLIALKFDPVFASKNASLVLNYLIVWKCFSGSKVGQAGLQLSA
jgi:hypothetical protein